MYKAFALMFNFKKEMASRCKTVEEQRHLMATMLRDAADRIEQGDSHGGFWFPEEEMEYDGMFSFFDREIGFTKDIDLVIKNEE